MSTAAVKRSMVWSPLIYTEISGPITPIHQCRLECLWLIIYSVYNGCRSPSTSSNAFGNENEKFVTQAALSTYVSCCDSVELAIHKPLNALQLNSIPHFDVNSIWLPRQDILKMITIWSIADQCYWLAKSLNIPNPALSRCPSETELTV